MQIEFTGIVEASELADQMSVRAAVQKVRVLARHGFDRVEILDHVGSVASVRLLDSVHGTVAPAITVVHRPGEMSPVDAAEAFARWDHASEGRLTVLFSDTALPSERAPLTHEADQARTDEYLMLLKRLWLSKKPFDFEGNHFRFESGIVSSRPYNEGTVRIALGGQSATAIRVAARHADCYHLSSLDLFEAAATMDRLETAAGTVGRSGKIRFSLDIAPVFDAPDEIASAASEADAEIASRLSGTPEQMAVTLLKYVDIGIGQFKVHRSTTSDHLAIFAERVIPLVRRAVEHRNAQDLPKPQVSGVPPWSYQAKNHLG